MLHVLNGDATRVIMERSTVPGEMAVWADVLHDGPTPAGLAPDAWRHVRARHLASRFGRDEQAVLAGLRAADSALERWPEHDEVVFWFEHDLFDQLILIRHLRWLSAIAPASTRFSLICVGAFPGIENFNGLGQLSPEQLASLLERRQTITATQLDAGHQAWTLFCGSDPGPLQQWLQHRVRELPFLSGALRRHFEDYPSRRNGLGRTERQMLTALADGRRTFSEMFRACQVREERVYLGDAVFWAILRDLATASRPLVKVHAEGSQSDLPRDMPTGGVEVQLTGTGLDVLEGRADHIVLNGIDRWMGGVHLTPDHCWRSDGEALVLEDGAP